MAPVFKLYMLCWSVACLVGLILFMKGRKSFGICSAEYWQFLVRPWRITTFVIAASLLIVIAPYTGDRTWDYFDAFFMSVLTYATAPWAVGALYRVAKGKLNVSQGYVAACLWMFSASWSYDLYLVLRDGHYPITWYSNIFASSILYISAGLFWSLDWVRGRGVTFSFQEDPWPYSSTEGSFSKVIWFGLPFMALVSVLMLYFFWFKLG